MAGSHLDPKRIATAFAADPDLPYLLHVANNGVDPHVVGRDMRHDEQRWQRAGAARAPDVEEALMRLVAEEVALGHSLVLPDSVARSLLPADAAVAPMFGIVKTTDSGTVKTRLVVDLKFAVADRDSVNAATDMSAFVPVTYGGTFDEMMQHLYHTRLLNPDAHIVFSKADTHAAYRQIPLNPRHAHLFTYRVAGLLVVDLRLPFGWRGSPAVFDRFACALVRRVHAATPATPTSAEAVAMAREHVAVEPTVPVADIVRLPVDATAFASASKQADTPRSYFIWMFVDDTMSIMVWRDADGLLHLTALIIDGHLLMFGNPSAHEYRSSPVSQKKLTNHSTREVLLGVTVDSVTFTVSLPPDKRAKVNTALFETFRPSTATATVGKLESLVGYLRFLAYVVRPGQYFLQQITYLVRTHVAAHGRGSATEVVLTTAFHEDMDMWRCLIASTTLSTSSLAIPMSFYVERPPALEAYSDAATGWGIGGYCANVGVWYQLPFPHALQLRINNGTVHINQLELAGMLLNAYVILVLADAAVPGEALLLRGDNSSAVAWITNGGCGHEGSAGHLMRAMALLEIHSGMSFIAKHVAGSANVLADAMSRSILSDDPSLPPSWVQHTLPTEISAAICGMLLGVCKWGHWHQALKRTTRRRGFSGFG